MPELHFDAIVIGSGFGGSAAAFRLAEAGKSVCVLERGKAYPPGSFPRSPRKLAANVWDPSEGRHGLFNIWSFRNIESIVSSGLGGGSLIYANVLLRKDERWFTQTKPDGSGPESWPVTRSDLDPHYDTVERMMGVQQFPFGAKGYEAVTKTQAMRDAAGKLGYEWGLPNLAVTFAGLGRPPVPGEPIEAASYANLHGKTRLTCRLCGECDLGCNDGSKNSLDHTYLSAAAAKGAEIRTRCEVRLITPSNGGYEVAYVEHLPENEGRPTPTGRLPLRRITASRVVVAAGTFGSTFLLLRNRRALSNLGPALGTRFSGNGDVLSFAKNARAGDQPRWLNPSSGPVITSFIRVPDDFDEPPGGGPGFYVEDAGYPAFAQWLLEATQVPGTVHRSLLFLVDALRRALRLSRNTDVSGAIGRLLGEGVLSDSSLPLLGMGRDVPDGIMALDGDYLDVKWTSDGSRRFLDRMENVMRDVAQSWGAEFVANPLALLSRLVTVHPLGGCPMSNDAATGVVNDRGECFGHPSLYVADGAVMPGPVGANPALTIAAFSDRMCDRMLENWGSSLRPHDYGVVPPVPTQVEFTEVMSGHVTSSETDFVVAERAGQRQGTPLTVTLTVTMDDIDAFISDPEHEGSIRGTVDCPLFGGTVTVERGVFNLFAASNDPGTTEMRYRLYLQDGSGAPRTVAGFKTVRNDPGLDIWSDTTTLYTRIFEGHVSAGEEATSTIVATGIIRIGLGDFMQQLTTFRARGPDRLTEIRGLAAFGKLFMGALWATYGRPASMGAGR